MIGASFGRETTSAANRCVEADISTKEKMPSLFAAPPTKPQAAAVSCVGLADAGLADPETMRRTHRALALRIQRGRRWSCTPQLLLVEIYA